MASVGVRVGTDSEIHRVPLGGPGGYKHIGDILGTCGTYYLDTALTMSPSGLTGTALSALT